MKMRSGLLAVASVLTAASGCVQPPPPPVVNVDVGSSAISVAGPAGSRVEASVADPVSLPEAPADVSYPFGALSVNVSSLPPGGSARVTIKLPAPADAVRKLVDGVWDPFAPDGSTGATLSADGRTIAVDLVDGGRGDADGAANGTIVDPLAPALTSQVGVCLDSSYASSEPNAGFSEPGVADLRLSAEVNTPRNVTFYASIDGSCSGLPIPGYTVIKAPDIPSAIAVCGSLGLAPYGTLFGYGRPDWYLCS